MIACKRLAARYWSGNPERSAIPLPKGEGAAKRRVRGEEKSLCTPHPGPPFPDIPPSPSAEEFARKRFLIWTAQPDQEGGTLSIRNNHPVRVISGSFATFSWWPRPPLLATRGGCPIHAVSHVCECPFRRGIRTGAFTRNENGRRRGQRMRGSAPLRCSTPAEILRQPD